MKYVSQNLGFDEYDVASPAIMQTWWQNSPKYAVGFYANGAPSHASDPNLNATWIASVRSQGGGILPIWSASPCACKPNTGTYPKCTAFPYTSSSDPNTAKLDVENQADAAFDSVTSLGLDGSLI
jgi:hypothetical protein